MWRGSANSERGGFSTAYRRAARRTDTLIATQQPPRYAVPERLCTGESESEADYLARRRRHLSAHVSGYAARAADALDQRYAGNGSDVTDARDERAACRLEDRVAGDKVTRIQR